MSEVFNSVTWYRIKRQNYKELAERVEKILIELLNINKINYALTQSRAKSIESFQTKTKDPKYDEKHLHDLAGIRAVGYVRSDVNKIIKIINDNFKVDPDKSKDKSKFLSVDRFGYQAIHLVCTLPNERIVLPEYKKFKDMYFEIQIKTILEHAWAEIEHDRNYKYKGLPKDIRRDFYLISGSLELADNQFDDISKRIENYDKEITQKSKAGKLKEIEINPATLKRYIIDQFSGKLPMELSYGGNHTGESEVNELLSMGINTLLEFEQIIPPKFIEAEKIILKNKFIIRTEDNFTSIVFAILIMAFGKEYFPVALKERKFEKESFDIDLNNYQEAISQVAK